MRKTFLVLPLVCVVFAACNRIHCVPDLDLIPMYGDSERCKAQVDLENKFIKSCKMQYNTRDEACREMVRFGWKHYAKGDLDTAMRRFNQAWLLDSLNADIYWGFGMILTDRGSFSEAVSYYNRALQIDPRKSTVRNALALNYEALFDKSHDTIYLQSAINEMKKTLADSIPNYYRLLAHLYEKKGSADSSNLYSDEAKFLTYRER